MTIRETQQHAIAAAARNLVRVMDRAANLTGPQLRGGVAMIRRAVYIFVAMLAAGTFTLRVPGLPLVAYMLLGGALGFVAWDAAEERNAADRRRRLRPRR